MTPRLFGIIALLAVFVSDQITKFWAYDFLQSHEGNAVAITPFFNLVTVWNRGISFGLFNHGDPLPPLVLIALAFVISAFFTVWLWRCTHKPLALGLGAVIGGALGNIIDRFRFGAVFDFLDFHAFGWHWPAFNIADSAIVLGIAWVVADGLFFEAKRKGSQSHVQKA